MSYHHLTITERIKIETYLELGLKAYQMAKQKGRKSCLTPELKEEVTKHLKASWSPEQICGRYQLETNPMVTFKTIYNWLYSGVIELDLRVLRCKGKSL